MTCLHEQINDKLVEILELMQPLEPNLATNNLYTRIVEAQTWAEIACDMDAVDDGEVAQEDPSKMKSAIH